MSRMQRPDERWVTFSELARARGISRASASKLVRRKQWSRRTDAGRVLILVPLDALQREVSVGKAREAIQAAQAALDVAMSLLPREVA